MAPSSQVSGAHTKMDSGFVSCSHRQPREERDKKVQQNSGNKICHSFSADSLFFFSARDPLVAATQDLSLPR